MFPEAVGEGGNSVSRRPGSVLRLTVACRKFAAMSLAEIKSAVEGLSQKEFEELVAFIRERDSAAWDRQIELDAAAGKLDFLFEEAEQARAAGTLRDWPGK